MKAYILSVIGASLVAAVITLFTPDGKGGGIGKHVKLITSLALLAVIINPFLDFVKNLSATDFDSLKDKIIDSADPQDTYEKIFYESLSEMSASELEGELEKLISEKFGIKSENLSVNAEYSMDENTVCFKRITVILSGVAIFKDPYVIEAYVKDITGIESKCLL